MIRNRILPRVVYKICFPIKNQIVILTLLLIKPFYEIYRYRATALFLPFGESPTERVRGFQENYRVP